MAGAGRRSSRGLRHLPFALLALAYVGLGVAYQRSVPLFEAPDEPSHIHYVAFLSSANRLPVYGAQPDVPGEGMQPPLYYLLEVPLFRSLVRDPDGLIRDLRQVNFSLYRNVDTPLRPGHLIRRPARRVVRQFWSSPAASGLRHLRWPSLVFGLLAVTLTHAAMLRAFDARPIALLASGMLAFNPQFLFMSSCVSNDTAAAAVGACGLWLTAAALRDPSIAGRRRYYLLAALVAALALATKISILPGLALAGLAIFLFDVRPPKRRIADAALALCLLLLLTTPYLVWNASHRGDPLGIESIWQSTSHMLGYEAYGGAWAYFTGMYWTWTFESYWARFGWINVRAPGAVYLVYLLVTVLGLVGFLLAGRRKPVRPSEPGPGEASGGAPVLPTGFPGSLRLYLGAATLTMLLMHIWLNAQTAQPQGRHLFPAAPHFASLLALGISHLLGGRRGAIGAGACSAVLVALGGLALYCCFGVIVPAYR